MNASTKYRKMAINEGITSEAKRLVKLRDKLLLQKRFNVLRIYRRNNNKKACRKIQKI